MASSSSKALPVTLIIIAIVAVLAWFSIWVWQRSIPPQDQRETASTLSAVLEMPPFEYDIALLERQWEAQRGASSDFDIGPPEERLIEEFAELNRNLASDRLSEVQMDALRDHFSASVTNYISMRGPDAYRELGWHLYEPFLRAIESAASLTEGSGSSVREVVRRTGPESRSILDIIGNFFDVAIETGVCDSQGRLLVDPTLVAILFRYRWFSFAEAYASLALMTGYEREVFWRWRIESARGFSLRERLSMMDRAEAIYRQEGMGPDRMRAILAFRAGDLERTERFLRRAFRNDPDNADLRRALHELRQSDAAEVRR